jgi:hypothetical protein
LDEPVNAHVLNDLPRIGPFYSIGRANRLSSEC